MDEIKNNFANFAFRMADYCFCDITFGSAD